MYNNRIIRVRLRELNPPSRHGHRKSFGAGDISSDTRKELYIDGPGSDVAASFSSENEAIEFTVPKQPLHIDIPSPIFERTIEFPPSPKEEESPKKIQIPSASPLSSTADATPRVQQPTAFPYPLPFYSHGPWVPGYPPHYSYPVPYVPGYHPYGLPQPYMAAAPITYAVPQESIQQQPLQPPLAPTGFFQGEQGALIPVYAVDALEKYMAGADQTGPSPSVSSATDHTTPVSVAAAPQYHYPHHHPYNTQFPVAWTPVQQPLVSGSYFQAPNPNNGISPTHRTPLFPATLQNEHRGKRSGRNHSSHHSSVSQYRFQPTGVSGAERTHQMPTHGQDWTMWTGNR